MDLDLLKREHRFLREDDDEPADEVTRNYEKGLIRDFVIADTSRWQERMLGLRWRTVDEVRTGKGDSICAAKGCHSKDNLKALELLFVFREGGEDKRTLVTCIVCAPCSEKVVFAKTDPAEAKRQKREKKRAKKEQKDKEKAEKKAAKEAKAGMDKWGSF